MALILLPAYGEHEPPAGGEDHRSVLADVWDVLRQAVRRRELLAMLAVFGVANFAATPAITAGVPLLAKMRGWTAPEYGWVMAGFALGCVGGAVTLALWGARLRHPARWSAGSMAPGAAAVSVIGLAESSTAAACAAALAGVTFQAGAGALMATIKHTTPAEEMGRMMSLVQMSVYSLIPAGLVTFGAVAAATSAREAQLLMAAVMAAGGVAALSVRALRDVRVGEGA